MDPDTALIRADDEPGLGKAGHVEPLTSGTGWCFVGSYAGVADPGFIEGSPFFLLADECPPSPSG